MQFLFYVSKWMQLVSYILLEVETFLFLCWHPPKYESNHKEGNNIQTSKDVLCMLFQNTVCIYIDALTWILADMFPN